MRFEVLIDGMLSVHARQAVFTALGAVEGVTRAEVELGRAVVELPAEGVEEGVDARLRSAIELAGCTVTAVRRLPRTLPTI